MKVRWTDKARRHLRAIRDYIATDSPKYAARTIDRITRKGEGLKRFPLSGHVVPEYEVVHIRQVLEGTTASSTASSLTYLRFWLSFMQRARCRRSTR